MVGTREYMEELVDKRIEKKFLLVEEKIRNSFKAMKKDNGLMKQNLTNLQFSLNKFQKDSDLKNFKERFQAELNSLIEKSKKSNNEVEDLLCKFSNKGLREEIGKEIYKNFEKKQGENFSKQKDFIISENKKMKDELNLIKSSFRREIDSYEDALKDFSRKLDKISD
jgi:Fe-S cluster biosynthesis and repair protein YggX